MLGASLHCQQKLPILNFILNAEIGKTVIDHSAGPKIKIPKLFGASHRSKFTAKLVRKKSDDFFPQKPAAWGNNSSTKERWVGLRHHGDLPKGGRVPAGIFTTIWGRVGCFSVWPSSMYMISIYIWYSLYIDANMNITYHITLCIHKILLMTMVRHYQDNQSEEVDPWKITVTVVMMPPQKLRFKQLKR